jgi:Protein of unknown function (DUF2795)
VDFNPDDAPRYLEGLNYPARKEDLISTEINDAPDDLVERIGALDRAEYSSIEDVVAELRASPHPT